MPWALGLSSKMPTRTSIQLRSAILRLTPILRLPPPQLEEAKRQLCRLVCIKFPLHRRHLPLRDNFRSRLLRMSLFSCRPHLLSYRRPLQQDASLTASRIDVILQDIRQTCLRCLRLEYTSLRTTFTIWRPVTFSSRTSNCSSGI